MEFINMESALGQLTSQQEAISTIAPLVVKSVGQKS
jgi:hypothetical protein